MPKGRKLGDTKYKTQKDILLILSRKNEGKLSYKELRNILKKSSSTISYNARKLSEKGCVRIEAEGREHFVVLDSVSWKTLKSIVEIFKYYEKDYIHLMETKFGDLVVKFLLNEIRELKRHPDFKEIILRISEKNGVTYLERNLEEFIKKFYNDDETRKLSVNLLKKLGFNVDKKSFKDPIGVLFDRLLREAIKRQAQYKLDEEVIELGVKDNYYFLEYIVKCHDGILHNEDADRLAKFALAVLSIPPALHASMWKNVKKHLVDFYRSTFDSHIKRKSRKGKDEVKGDFQELSSFVLTFGGLGYLFYKDPEKLLRMLLFDRPELLNSLHIIGFLSSSIELKKYLLLEIA